MPTNIFADLAGTRSTSVIGVVVFAVMLGLAALALRKDNPELGERVLKGIETFQALVLRLVRMVIRLTPYGVLALMTRVVATSNVNDVINLGAFVVASYVGMGIILLMHAAILAATGISPVRFYQKIWPVLTFAFTSRSSGAAIPLSVETQVTRLGVSPAIANFSASFGATIGQNACAGLYPAMLAVMIAPSAGVDPTSFSFLASLVGVATLGSFGIAGVGGGATFAALVVLSTPQPAGGVGRAADLGRAAHRHGPHGGERERVDDGGRGHQPLLGQTDLAVFAADEPLRAGGRPSPPRRRQPPAPCRPPERARGFGCTIGAS